MQASGSSGEVGKKRVPPRIVPSRDEKYMGLAFVYASFSKDPNTQHGAQIVTQDNFPLGAGYNGPPREIADSDINWARPDKYPYVNHAEYNAIRHSQRDRLPGATIYVTGKPCPDCMLKLVTEGIKEVVYFDDLHHHDSGSMCVSQEALDTTDDVAKKAGVALRPFAGNLNWLRDRMEVLRSLGIFDGRSI